MSNAMSNIHKSKGNPNYQDDKLRLELYGPSGLRKLIRTNLQITQTILGGKYAVHELLFPQDKPTACDPPELHQNEAAGRDIQMDGDGFWRDFEDSRGIKVDAGPIVHRVPCIGYVFKERPKISIEYGLYEMLASISKTGIELPPRDIPGRKIVILGDTSDPSAIAPLAQDASLLVHEATNAWLPPALALEEEKYRDPEEIRRYAISRGHSTPDMAGRFANAIRAHKLVLNHLSIKYPNPSLNDQLYPSRQRVIEEIEDQASRAWKMGRAIVARDLLVVNIAEHDSSNVIHI